LNSAHWLLACATLVLSTAVSAQIVECIDANGNKTYMQSCPNSMTKKRDVEAPPPVPPKDLSAKAAANKSLAEQEKAFEQRRAAQTKAQAAADAKEKKAKDDAASCAEARRRLDLLGLGKQYKRVDPTTGVPLPVDEDDRQSEINSLNTKIESTCQ
jgi:hypothetical protein